MDDNVDYSRLDIEDISDESEDRNAEILDKLHIVRETFESLNLGTTATRVLSIVSSMMEIFLNGNFRDIEAAI